MLQGHQQLLYQTYRDVLYKWINIIQDPFRVIDLLPFAGSGWSNGIPIAPVGKIKLVIVCTVFEVMLKSILDPGLTIANDWVPAIGPAAFLNHLPGSSVILKKAWFPTTSSVFKLLLGALILLDVVRTVVISVNE